MTLTNFEHRQNLDETYIFMYICDSGGQQIKVILSDICALLSVILRN
jgi:hypothetical protein